MGSFFAGHVVGSLPMKRKIETFASNDKDYYSSSGENYFLTRIPSILIFCLTNSNTMVYVAWLWTRLEATSPTGCNSFNLTVNGPVLKLSAVVSPRDPFWAPCFSCSILMIKITNRRSLS